MNFLGISCMHVFQHFAAGKQTSFNSMNLSKPFILAIYYVSRKVMSFTGPWGEFKQLERRDIGML